MHRIRRMVVGTSASILLGFMLAGAAPAGAEESKLMAWDRFKAYTHQEKNEAVKAGQRLIAATDKKVAELKKEAKKAGKDAKVRYDEQIAELEAKKRDAKARLAKMKQSGTNAWDATKDGFAAAYRDLNEAYDKAVAATKK